jgi:hypothetical protein
MKTSNATVVRKFGHLTCIWRCVGRVPTRSELTVSGEEGAHLLKAPGRSHLPLRGKLGWMTPWFGPPRPNQGTRPLGTFDPKRGSLFYFAPLRRWKTPGSVVRDLSPASSAVMEAPDPAAKNAAKRREPVSSRRDRRLTWHPPRFKEVSLASRWLLL